MGKFVQRLNYSLKPPGLPIGNRDREVGACTHKFF
jgi:hypothetical protein